MLDLWHTTSASTSKLYVNGTSKSNVSNASAQFYPDFLSVQNMVRGIEGIII